MSTNVCFFVGKICGEIRTRKYGMNGDKTCMYFDLGVKRDYKEGGRYLNDFIFCECFLPDKQKYLLAAGGKKDVMVAIWGRLSTAKWEDKNHVWHSRYSIRVENVQVGLLPISFKELEELPDKEDVDMGIDGW